MIRARYEGQRRHGKAEVTLLTFAALAVGAVSCSQEPAVHEPGPRRDAPAVYVVNYPLKYFADRIGRGAVDVRFPAPRGVDPAFWQPSAAAVTAYQNAELILLNGAGYARWIERAPLPVLNIVNTSRAFKDRYIEVPDAVNPTASTTWLDPVLAIEQARVIRDVFVSTWPRHANDFEAGLADLEGDLRELDDEISRIVGRRADRTLIASHPVYEYLGRRCGFRAVTLNWEPDEIPDEAAWRELEMILAEHPVRFMVWKVEPVAETVQRLNDMGVRNVVISPCANVPQEGDYLAVMRANLQRLATIYSE